ncbi:hypothetical protein MP638_002119 [Amoeboaphelidium occidentale]|nr:hypothetical protein MP638_002119 [Amoeboaphelidium occidentale]
MDFSRITEYDRKLAALDNEIEDIKKGIKEAEGEATKYPMFSKEWNYWNDKEKRLSAERNKLREERKPLVEILLLKEKELALKKDLSVVVNGFPLLGQRQLSTSKSVTRTRSVYNVQITATQAEFGILDDLKLNKLNASTISNLWNTVSQRSDKTLGPWSGEDGIQKFVYDALRDSLAVAGLIDDLNVHTETTFSISRIMAKHEDRVDVTALVNNTKSIAGVCEVKLPGFNMDKIVQTVDYMIDLRNYFNVRFVFGILSTYNKWRVLWFRDTDVAAQEKDKQRYDLLCHTGTANDYSISDKVSVVMTRVYDHKEQALIELLASVLYKLNKTPISTPDRFAESHKKYVFARKESFVYKSLPDSLLGKDSKPFTYKMPGAASSFFILQYYHRGGDGRVALGCSLMGKLCVLKFLLKKENEKELLKEEAKLWDLLWGTKCRVVEIAERFALLMPFCFHIRILGGRPVFCGMSAWNKRLWSGPTPVLKDSEVSDFDLVNMEQFNRYQQSPEQAAEEALKTMISHGKMHSDLKWEHVALCPKYCKETNQYDLHPVLLDLTRIKPFEPIKEADTSRVIQDKITELENKLEEYNKLF